MIDYHTHSKYSDGKNTYEEIIRKAVEKGLQEIGFSDHLCLHYPGWAAAKDDFENIKEEITSLKKSTNDIQVKFGLEVDYIKSMENNIRDHIKKFPVDYIIGSIHYIDDWNFDTTPKAYPGKDMNQTYLDYFDLLQQAALSGLFDIMGHIDVIKKFNFYPDFDLKPYYERTAEVFSNSDVVFELNTSGLDKPCKELYPSDEFLKSCFDQNVPVTLGSDAHIPSQVARYFSLAVSKLKHVGYRKITIFNQRKRSYITL